MRTIEVLLCRDGFRQPDRLTAVETQISHAIAAAHQGAEGLKHILSGYLPSTGAGAVGMFFGFRKR